MASSSSEKLSLDILLPEIQAQIMRNIDSVQNLISLLHASPRFYQVFRSRREYLLTQLAFNQFQPEIINTVWNLAKALQLPRPATRDRVHEHINKNFGTYRPVDNDFQQPSISSAVTIPLCKIGRTIAWFVEDYRQSSLKLLTDLGTHMELRQNEEILHSHLSPVELGRLQRAFCRFETFCSLFVAAKNDEDRFAHGSQVVSFLMEPFTADEVEEIACIRDYLIRRLWTAFEALENNALQGDNSDAIRKLGRECTPDFFGSSAKYHHLDFMEYLLSQGLPFLRTILESEGLQRAELIISNAVERHHFLTDALKGFRQLPPSMESNDYFDGKYEEDCEADFEEDDVYSYTKGLLWAHNNKIPADYARRPLKGFRDWGYVFWDSWRLQASGILEKKPYEVAAFYFNDQARVCSIQERSEYAREV
ncbi:MAG: hypothetical protein Q9166_006432 [cf. Caloplaca sp. 2 TL-2023]